LVWKAELVQRESSKQPELEQEKKQTHAVRLSETEISLIY